MTQTLEYAAAHAAGAHAARAIAPVTVELTGKRWKAYTLVAAAAAFVFFLVLIAAIVLASAAPLGAPLPSSAASGLWVGGVGFGVSMLVFCVIRVMAWWHHG